MTCTKLITRNHWWYIKRIIVIDITLVFQYYCHKWELIIFQNILKNIHRNLISKVASTYVASRTSVEKWNILHLSVSEIKPKIIGRINWQELKENKEYLYRSCFKWRNVKEFKWSVKGINVIFILINKEWLKMLLFILLQPFFFQV